MRSCVLFSRSVTLGRIYNSPRNSVDGKHDSGNCFVCLTVCKSSLPRAIEVPDGDQQSVLPRALLQHAHQLQPGFRNIAGKVAVILRLVLPDHPHHLFKYRLYFGKRQQFAGIHPDIADFQRGVPFGVYNSTVVYKKYQPFIDPCRAKLAFATRSSGIAEYCRARILLHHTLTGDEIAPVRCVLRRIPLHCGVII